MSANRFVQQVANLSFENTFNPYSDFCPVYDRPGAPQKRCRALQEILKVATDREIDAIWIGRDLGYRGGRRTGLALTDDVNIPRHARRWGAKIERPTNGSAVAERTAATIWQVLDEIAEDIFLWNVFPLHPHEPGEPFTNRAHVRAEREAGEEVLRNLVALLRPKRLVAIGNDAAASIARIAPLGAAVTVRHPSYGGHNIFLRQMAELYPSTGRQPTLL